MKRKFEIDEDRDCKKILRCNDKNNLMERLPIEIFEIIMKGIEIEDLKKVSNLNKSIRVRVMPILFKQVKVKWEDIKWLSEWKHNYNIVKVRILREEGKTAKSEWNVSIKPLFLCINLKELEMELIGSSRCLKYKDDFKSEESYKIEKITLVSGSGGYGDYCEKALFESTHIRRFRGLQSITVNGFTLGRDVYEEAEAEGEAEGEGDENPLSRVRELSLVNCVWEYPNAVSDIFRGCRPERVHVQYAGDALRFTGSERFRALVAGPHAVHRWRQSERRWWSLVRVVEVVLGSGSGSGGGVPSGGVQVPAAASATAFTRESLPRLEKVVLVGWR